MPGKVTLKVEDGPMQGRKFLFDEHDTFLFGRTSDCDVRLPDDPMVSRHHFIMEANPPDARIRDLGSLNGTYVNNFKYGSRETGETPEEGSQRKYPEVDLKNGDRISVGKTIFKVHIEVPAVCYECDTPISKEDQDRCAWIGGTFICAVCKSKLIASAQPAKKPEPPKCQQCGRDVLKEIGRGRHGDYICNKCRQQVEADPGEMIARLLGRAGTYDQTPEIRGYEIKKKLGMGGCGAVYMAHRKKDGKQVAIKVMLSRVAVSRSAREKFMKEIDLLRNLKHKNIVPLLDQGSTGGAFYFIMEYCDGGSVQDLLERQRDFIPISGAGQIIIDALKGLEYTHNKKIVHRDIKPGNILLSGTGSSQIAKIADLGLAKNFQQAGLSGMTVTGGYAGTPGFMPREQITDFKYVKPVSDLWSMAATIYKMITGEVPYKFLRGEDPISVILRGEIVPIRERNSSIPKQLADVIDRTLSTNVDDRYKTAKEMRQALEKVL